MKIHYPTKKYINSYIDVDLEVSSDDSHEETSRELTDKMFSEEIIILVNTRLDMRKIILTLESFDF